MSAKCNILSADAVADARLFELTPSSATRLQALRYIEQRRKEALHQCASMSAKKCNMHNLITITVHKRDFQHESNNRSDCSFFAYDYVEAIAKERFPNAAYHFIVFSDNDAGLLPSFSKDAVVNNTEVSFPVQVMMAALSDFHIGTGGSTVEYIINLWRLIVWHFASLDSKYPEIKQHTAFFRDRKITNDAWLYQASNGLVAPKDCAQTQKKAVLNSR